MTNSCEPVSTFNKGFAWIILSYVILSSLLDVNQFCTVYGSVVPTPVRCYATLIWCKTIFNTTEVLVYTKKV